MRELEFNHILTVAKDTILEAEYCFLITLGGDGQPHTRLMQPFEADEDFVIHFGASSESRKVSEIQADNRITLGYALPEEGAYVTLVGRASLVTEPEAKSEYWRESFADYWPEGASSAGYSVIRFEPERIEVMNFKKNVAPEPYGLKPAVLSRSGEGWKITYPRT